MPFQVFFHSLEATNSLPASTPLFILHTEALSCASIRKIQDFLGRYGRSITFLNASQLIPKKLPIREGDHVSPATFYRLFIAQILPAEIHRAVYLDVDMLAVGSISELFTLSLNSLVAAADHCAPSEGVRLWGECGGNYFQAGVLVIPVDIWRKEALSTTFVQVMQTHEHAIRWWDQDVLNIALRDQWQRLSIWFNTCDNIVRTFPDETVHQFARLIHFSGNYKPWNSLNPSPFVSHWDDAYRDAFNQSFNRKLLMPPLPIRLKSAARSRLLGLIHGSK
jgi:lipopolysaccharide biosynthesis glycosyltransferase